MLQICVSHSELKSWAFLNEMVWDRLYIHPWTLSLGLASDKPRRAVLNVQSTWNFNIKRASLLDDQVIQCQIQHRVSLTTCSGYAPGIQLNSSMQSCHWEIFTAESKETVVIWSCLATLPGSLIPRDNQMSIIDYSTNQSLNILCPSPPYIHGHWPQNFSISALPEDFLGKELFMVMECSSKSPKGPVHSW